MTQPFPKFYIIRPDGSLSPLIPVDELPKWVSFANWDPEDISIYSYMYAASLTSFPREGEYDLVCHNCFAQVDGHHRSVSEQSDLGISMSLPALTFRDTINMSGSLAIKTPTPAPSQITKVPILPTILKQPPFQANLYSPFVGMCLVSFPRLQWPFRFGSTAQDQDDQTDEEENEDQSEQRRPLHSNHSASDADDESDGEGLFPPPLAPLLDSMDIPKQDQDKVDLELGFGTSTPSLRQYFEPVNESLSKHLPLDAGLSLVTPDRHQFAEGVAPKRPAIGRKASSSRRGTKRVRFNSSRAGSSSSQTKLT
ncbi:uncharacterized protein KD926_007964 [Aspergillus affinis]|uniref:uncharacterized protein n=1 Tax=Aspergillus affinis TaxID=1070780 RepID=UPI0022FE7630|nr:uncharacterized protein KD926_007964 [Aspergillus affinis]KAI9045548.1 hypothetical protein KD926_007964 [Aspergillus affinis]